NPFLMEGAPCDDGDSCTAEDLCVDGACFGTPQPDLSACDDGDSCTLGDVCHDGVCEGMPSDTCDDEERCAPDGSLCDDGNPCTTGDVCVEGSCIGDTGPME